jgi:hypothetical protein
LCRPSLHPRSRFPATAEAQQISFWDDNKKSNGMGKNVAGLAVMIPPIAIARWVGTRFFVAGEEKDNGRGKGKCNSRSNSKGKCGGSSLRSE